jgi:hypothetical protein
MFLPTRLAFASLAVATLCAAPSIQPVVVTEPVFFDSDDPAIWVNRADPRAEPRPRHVQARFQRWTLRL